MPTPPGRPGLLVNGSMAEGDLYRQLLDNQKTGVALLDGRLCLLYLNMEAEHLLGISGNKARQLFIGEVLLNGEDDIAQMAQAVRTNVRFTRRSVELCTRQGRTFLADYTISPMVENREFQAILEISSLEPSHRITREESLEAAQMTTRELLRGLAHEIKNPLGGIRGAAQLLAQEILGTGHSAGLQDYTNVIIEEADRLCNLVDRLAGSRKPLDLAEINIHEVLERVRNLVDADVASQNIRLMTDYDPSIPPVHADSDQLIQAILNLVRNAQQALVGSRGPQAGQIVLRTRIFRNATIGDHFHRLAVEVQVEDNGPGIPTDMLGTIFYPMISGRADGSGLGLPIAHGIVIQHRGLIQCGSKPGLTVFSVILPLPAGQPHPGP